MILTWNAARSLEGTERSIRTDHSTMLVDAIAAASNVTVHRTTARCPLTAGLITVGRSLSAPTHTVPTASTSIPRDAAALVSSAVDTLATRTL